MPIKDGRSAATLLLSPFRFFFLVVILNIYVCVGKKKNNNFKSYLQSPVMPRVPKCEFSAAGPIHDLMLHQHQSELKQRKAAAGKLVKQTRKKFLLSTMFKDEEGFLAEYVAYYKVHGFDHIILWDHNSGDNFQQELLPWTSTGYVEIRNVNALFEHPNVKNAKGGKYWQIIGMKKQIERENWLWGIKNGYDFYLTADIDEYVLPMFNNYPLLNAQMMALDPGYIDENAPIPYMTVADAVVDIFALTPTDVKFKRGPKMYIPIVKYNYNAAPHILEPVDLLTIEAYLTRFTHSRNMNFYMSVQPKYIYRLSGEDLTSGGPSNMTFFEDLSYNEYNNVSFTDMQIFHANCCFFHGCSAKNRNAKNVCAVLGGPSYKHLFKYDFNFHDRSSRQHSPYWIRMNHYARSLEKYTLKALTWETANQASNHYELSEYLNRAYGQRLDPSALLYSCLVRAEINRARHAYVLGGLDDTDAAPSFDFVRSGASWNRRLEHLNARRQMPEGNYSVPYNEALASRIYSEQHRYQQELAADQQLHAPSGDPRGDALGDADWRKDGVSDPDALFIDYYEV